MNRREALATTGTALSAALGSLALSTVPATTAPSIAQELVELIATKETAHVAFTAALRVEEEAEDAYFATHPKEHIIPLSVGGGLSLLGRIDLDRDQGAPLRNLQGLYDREANRLETAARISPAAIEQVTADLDSAMAKDLRRLGTIVRRERKERKATGFQQVMDARDTACDADANVLIGALRLSLSEHGRDRGQGARTLGGGKQAPGRS